MPHTRRHRAEPARRWRLSVLSALPAVLALAVCALALVLTAAVHLLPAVRASRPQRAPDSGGRPGPSRQERRLWQGRLSQEDV